MRRTAEDAKRTRLALLEAALMTFEERGWKGATFEHVANRAGVTRGALHHHFRSKNDLLEQALAWGWEQYGARLFPASEQDAVHTPARSASTSLLTGDGQETATDDPEQGADAYDSRKEAGAGNFGQEIATDNTRQETATGNSLSSLLTGFITLLREDERFRALAACTVLVAPQAFGEASRKDAALDAKNAALAGWRTQIVSCIRTTDGTSADAVASLVLVLFHGLTVTAVTCPDDLPHPGELSATVAALAKGLLLD